MARPTTPHYGIAKYGDRGTHDAMDVYGVYNAAMDTIDKILFDLKGLIDALETRMDNAENRLDAIDQHLERIDQHLERIDNNITNMGNKYDSVIQDILNKIYGGGTVGGNGHITWPNDDKIALGNMNIYGGGTANHIRTRADGENDVQVN